jgi:hypothetical protein
MKISKEKKKEILLVSFNVLKNDYNSNSSKLQEIINKMLPVDIDTAVEMWIYLLNNYKHYIKDSIEAYGLTEGIIFSASQSIGYIKIGEIIVNNDLFKQIVFRQSACVSYNTMFIIRNYILSNDLIIANELLELVYKNKNSKEHSFGGYIENLFTCFDPDSSITEEAFSLLQAWIDKIKNEEENAKANVGLLSLLSE